MHERQSLQQLHILFVFQQRAMQPGQGIGTVPFEILRRQVFGQKQFQPVNDF